MQTVLLLGQIAAALAALGAVIRGIHTQLHELRLLTDDYRAGSSVPPRNPSPKS